MLERLQKYLPLIISVIFHAILAAVIIFSFTKPSGKKAELGVSIMSNQLFSEICQKQQRVIKSKNKHQHLSTPKNNGSIIQKDIDEDLNKNQGRKITDLSYVKDIYKIGSQQNPAPPYPRIAKLRNYQGLVEICIISNSNGEVVNAEVHKSSGHPSLDRSALKTIKNWKLAIKSDTKKQIKERLYRVIVPINFVISN